MPEKLERPGISQEQIDERAKQILVEEVLRSEQRPREQSLRPSLVGSSESIL